MNFILVQGCGKNLFKFKEISKGKKSLLKLEDNLVYIPQKSPEAYCCVCAYCFYPLYTIICETQKDEMEFAKIKIINSFIHEHPEKIDKKLKEIWTRFLKQEIKSRFKEILN